jgi:hypothetical protein
MGALADDTYLDNRQCLACEFTFREADDSAPLWRPVPSSADEGAK